MFYTLCVFNNNNQLLVLNRPTSYACVRINLIKIGILSSKINFSFAFYI